MTEKPNTIQKMRQDLIKIRLNIRAGKEKNTNAHKKIKKEIARFLTKGETK